ncbi:MAG: lytic transglycosylase domain-containing protein [Gammaproteobacteria bacterium]|nr:lytic transglycosylase domain-containing protein [Gammaproteobacteria bacterium]
MSKAAYITTGQNPLTQQRHRQNLCAKLVLAVTLALTSSIALATNDARPDPILRQLLIDAVNETDSFDNRFHAEVWLMDMSQRLEKTVPQRDKRIELLKTVHQEATRADLPPELVLAVINVESNFDRWAISVSGARGLMQIMPFWLKEIGRPNDNLFHLKTNLRFGCTILRHYLDIEKGNLSRALGRYNGSLGEMKYPNKVFDRLRQRWYR